ncbi:MAG: SDR family oxidoreductase [Actinomycetota bacterium]
MTRRLIPANLSYVRRSTVVRVFADLTVVAMSLVVVLAARYLIGATFGDDASTDGTATFLSSAVFGVVVLGSISVNVFSFWGFYRQTRTYRDRYKIKAIVQATAAAHLIFALVLLMLWDQVDFPRSTLIPSFVVTTLAIITVRLGLHRVDPIARMITKLDAAMPPSPTIERVLVVGGGGYIGSALLRKLLDSGYQVRLLDVLMFGEEPLGDLIDHPDLEIIREDFRRVHHVVSAMTDMDAVIHLGAIVGDPACAIDEQLTIDTNLVATRMVAEVAKAAGVQRFVFASTCSVYGAGDEILDERSEPNPVSLYAKSKIACEEILGDMAGDGFSPVILRFGTIYGLSGRTRFDLVVNLLTAKAVCEGEITVFGGQQWRPFLHVDDAAKAVHLALEAPTATAHNQVFNVGSNEQNYKIDDVGVMIRDMVPGSVIHQLGDDGDRRDYRVDFTRIRRELGFTPGWTVEMGIRQVIDAIRAGRVTDYTEARYSNVKSLKEQTIELPAPRPSSVQFRYEVRFEDCHGPFTVDLVKPDELVKSAELPTPEPA